MPIAVLTIALLAYIYIMVAYPALRRPGLALGAIVALALAAYIWLSGRSANGPAMGIMPSELILDELVIERTIRGAALSGRVLNRSEHFRLSDMTLSLRLHDCALEAATLSDCPVVAESTAIARTETPPNQIRGFTARFLFDTLPPPSSRHRWDWTIIEARVAR